MHDHAVVPFKARHLEGIDWIERERTKQIGFNRAFKAYESNPGWSLFCDGRFVAGGGVVVPYAGLGEGWVIAGSLAPSHTRLVCRTAREGLRDLIQGLKLVRVQAMVMRHYEPAHHFVRHLGFTQECLLRKYGLHGADLYLYSMFPGDLHA